MVAPKAPRLFRFFARPSTLPRSPHGGNLSEILWPTFGGLETALPAKGGGGRDGEKVIGQGYRGL